MNPSDPYSKSQKKTPILQQDLAHHYAHSGLLAAITNALSEVGKTPENISLTDLSPMDEFHVGGLPATQHLLSPLDLNKNHKVLDIGCGLGGTARYVAKEYGCAVKGIDLTKVFIDVGCELNNWTKLGELVSLHHGDALSLPFEDTSFDFVYMLHVGMNIEDKNTLFHEIARVLKPRGVCAIYDLMKTSEQEIRYPAPWSRSETTSFVESLDAYTSALENNQFTVTDTQKRDTFALGFYEQMKEAIRLKGKAPIGLHLHMGDEAELRLRNTYEAIAEGVICPTVVYAQLSNQSHP